MTSYSSAIFIHQEMEFHKVIYHIKTYKAARNKSKKMYIYSENYNITLKKYYSSKKGKEYTMFID